MLDSHPRGITGREQRRLHSISCRGAGAIADRPKRVAFSHVVARVVRSERLRLPDRLERRTVVSRCGPEIRDRLVDARVVSIHDEQGPDGSSRGLGRRRHQLSPQGSRVQIDTVNQDIRIESVRLRRGIQESGRAIVGIAIARRVEPLEVQHAGGILIVRIVAHQAQAGGHAPFDRRPLMIHVQEVRLEERAIRSQLTPGVERHRGEHNRRRRAGRGHQRALASGQTPLIWTRARPCRTSPRRLQPSRNRPTTRFRASRTGPGPGTRQSPR